MKRKRNNEKIVTETTFTQSDSESNPNQNDSSIGLNYKEESLNSPADIFDLGLPPLGNSTTLPTMEPENYFFDPHFSPIFSPAPASNLNSSEIRLTTSPAPVSVPSMEPSVATISLPSVMEKNLEIYQKLLLAIAKKPGKKFLEITSTVESTLSEKTLRKYMYTLADYKFIKIGSGNCYNLEDIGKNYLINKELITADELSAYTQQPPKQKRTSDYDHAVASWIDDMEESKLCYKGFNNDHLIFDFTNQPKTLKGLNNRISNARFNEERGLNRFFKMKDYLVVFSEDDFSDLHPKLREHLLKQNPHPFDEIKPQLISSPNLFNGIQAQNSYNVGTRKDYYETLKKYYYGDRDNEIPPEAFVEAPAEQVNPVIAEQSVDSHHYDPVFPLSEGAITALIRSDSAKASIVTTNVQPMTPIQSSSEENPEEWEISFFSQQPL